MGFRFILREEIESLYFDKLKQFLDYFDEVFGYIRYRDIEQWAETIVSCAREDGKIVDIEDLLEMAHHQMDKRNRI